MKNPSVSKTWSNSSLLITWETLSRIANRAERSIKPFVIGRKNFLFAVSPRGAQQSAIMYSIIETVKENRLDPFKYLTYIFKTAPGLDQSGPEWVMSLLPENATEECSTRIKWYFSRPSVGGLFLRLYASKFDAYIGTVNIIVIIFPVFGSRVIRRVYVNADFDTIEKALSSRKMAKKDAETGIPWSITDFESPVLLYGFVGAAVSAGWQLTPQKRRRGNN